MQTYECIWMPNIENDASHFCGYITIKKKKKKNALAIDLKRRHLQTFWFYVFVSGFDSCFAIVLQDSGGTLVILYLTLRASVLSLPLIN